jgi:hypothetical protein
MVFPRVVTPGLRSNVVVEFDMLHRRKRSELYDLVWSEPMRTLAARFDVSDVALGKTCRKADIPLLGLGYVKAVEAMITVSADPFAEDRFLQ